MSFGKAPIPTFIGIGYPKCATTWISDCLKSHPKIYLSSPKEIHFFDFEKNWNKGVDWYLKYFEGSDSYLARGEFTPFYIRNTQAAATRIKSLFGSVKLLVSIRNPIDRFLSQYKMTPRLFDTYGEVLNKQIFEQAIQLLPDLLRDGNYFQGIKHYFDFFDRENIHISIKEDIDKNPANEMRKIYGFLGVNPDFLSPYNYKLSNRGIIPKFSSLEILKKRIFRKLSSSKYPETIDLIKKMGISDLYRKLNSKSRSSSLQVEPEVLEELWKYYQEDISNLSALLGRDLNVEWRLPSVDR